MSSLTRAAQYVSSLFGFSANPPQPYSAREEALKKAALMAGGPDTSNDHEGNDWVNFRPPPPVAMTRWLQKHVEYGYVAAVQGNMQIAARLAESLFGDNVAGGLLQVRTGGLTRLPRRYRGSPEPISALQDDGRGPSAYDRMFQNRQLAMFLTDMLLLDVAVAQLQPIANCQERRFVRLDPQWLRYRWMEDRWYYLSNVGEIPITPGDERWVLFAPGQQAGRYGLWHGLSRVSIAKTYAFNYSEAYASKLAHPARVAVSPAGADEAQHWDWFHKVAKWGPNPVFATKPGYDVKIVESNGTGTQIFADTIDRCNKEFMVRLSGQEVMTTGGVGFANAEVFAAIRSDLIQDDAITLAQVLNEQVLGPWARRRWGAGAYVSLSWDTTPIPELKDQADAMVSAAKAIADVNVQLETMGFEVNVREMITRYNVPIVPKATPPALPQMVTEPAEDEYEIADDDLFELSDEFDIAEAAE